MCQSLTKWQNFDTGSTTLFRITLFNEEKASELLAFDGIGKNYPTRCADLGESLEVDEDLLHLLGEHLLQVLVAPHQLGEHLVPCLHSLQRGRVLGTKKANYQSINHSPIRVSDPPEGYKEMSSILAEPSYMSPKPRGEGGIAGP
jgi:hypothetical protein